MQRYDLEYLNSINGVCLLSLSIIMANPLQQDNAVNEF